MPDSLLSDCLKWLNTNGAVVSFVTSVLGFWCGLQTNLWVARRGEWNSVVDRVRVGLLEARRHHSIDWRIDDADLDLLLVQAVWWKRGRIQAAVDRHAEIARQGSRDKWGSVTRSPDQISEIVALREKLLLLVRRR